MPNTALNRTTTALLTNKSGGDLTYGAVVILDNTNASSFTTTTTAGLTTRGLGVIIEPNGIANNASGMVAVGGWCSRVTLNTAATVGQFLKSHTVAGQGTPHSSPQIAGDFGIALEASATPAAILFGNTNPPGSSASGDVVGPGAATDNGFAVYDGVTGKLIKNHAATVAVATEVSGLGTGVATALGANVGSAGAPVVNGGALGTPSSGVGTNLTGIPLSTGVTGVLPGLNGGGLVLLEQHTASASATLDFTTAISATYDDYIIEGVDLIAATDATSLLCRVGTGGGPTYDAGANYIWSRAYNLPGSAYAWTGSTGASGATSMTVMILVSNVNPTYFHMRLKSPQNASFIKMFTWEGVQKASDANYYHNAPAGGGYTATTALTALRFLMSSGNIASGTIRVYGVAK